MISRSLTKLSVFAVAAGGIALSTLRDRSGFLRGRELRGDVLALRARNATLARENRTLAREIEALRHDPAYQVRAVREELGFIRPGERVVELTAEGRP